MIRSISRASLGRRVAVCRLAGLAATVALLLVLAGCGGGGSSSSPSAASIASAKSGLNSIISGQTTASPTNVGDNAAKWKSLYDQDPSNPEIATGYAIAEAASAGENFDNSLDGPVPGLVRPAAARAIKAHQAQLAQFGQALAIWRLPALLNGSGSIEWPQATDFTPMFVSPALGGSQIQADLATLDHSLASVEQALSVPLSNPNYTFTIADPTNPSDTQRLKLGQAEFNALYTLAATLRGVISPLLAYDYSEPNYNGNTLISAVSSISSKLETQGASITPALYMAASPFLTLKAGGAADMAAAKSQLLAAASHGTDAINEVEARNNAGYLLDPGTFVTQNQLNQIKSQIATYQTYVTGPFQTDVTNGDFQTVQTTMDLNAWFTHPPADLKALMPSYTVQAVVDSNSSTGYDTTLLLSPSAYPDLTLGGLFPDGFPTSNAEDQTAFSSFDAGTEAPPLWVVNDEAVIWLMPDTEIFLVGP